jgi:hypothetical protein
MSAGVFAMIIGMSESTRRAEVRVLEVVNRMVRLSVDGGRDQWLSVGDVLWVDVPGEPFPPAEPSREEAMTNYRPVARDDAIGSWSRGDDVTIKDHPATLAWPAERFAYNHTRQEFTIGSWGEDGGAAPEGGRLGAFSEGEVRALHTALEDARQTNAVMSTVAQALLEEIEALPVAGYRGPGVYETFTGLIYEALGRIGANGAVILRLADGDGTLHAEALKYFNDVREDGTPVYRWVRALGEEA